MNFQLTTSKAFQFFHVLRQVVLIAIAVLLTKSSVSQSEIGNYEMLFFLLFSVSFFWVSGSIQGLLSTYPKLSIIEKKKLIFQLFLFFSTCSILVLLFLLLGEKNIVPLLTKQAQLTHYQLFIIFIFFNLPTYLVENIYLLENKAKAIVAFGLFSFVLQVVAIILPIQLGFGFRVSFICLAILSIGKYIWLLYLLTQTATINREFHLLWQTLKTALPLMLYALVGGFAQVFDSWLVSWEFEGDKSQFAIFRYGARELPLALAVATAFGNSMLPKLVENRTANLSVIKKKSLTLFHLLFPLSIIAALTSSILFPIILNPTFQESYLVFNIYLLILFSRLLFPHTILISLEENQFIFYVSIVELFINVVASIILVKSLGLMGIALGTVIAYSFEKVVYIIYLKRKFNISFQEYTDLRWWSGYTILLCGVVWWSV